MDWQILGTFLMATAVILATPGPVMAIIVGNTLNGGQKMGVSTVLGIGLGELLLVSLLALSFLLSSRLFGDVFPWFSLASAAYLAGLAASTIMQVREQTEARTMRLSSRPFVDGLAITVSNPTALLFYSAFFVPFIQSSQSMVAQLGVLVVLYLLLTLAFDMACVMFVTRLSTRRFRSTAFARIIRFASAAVYLGTSGLAINSFLQTLTP